MSVNRDVPGSQWEKGCVRLLSLGGIAMVQQVRPRRRPTSIPSSPMTSNSKRCPRPAAADEGCSRAHSSLGVHGGRLGPSPRRRAVISPTAFWYLVSRSISSSSLHSAQMSTRSEKATVLNK